MKVIQLTLTDKKNSILYVYSVFIFIMYYKIYNKILINLTDLDVFFF